MDVDKPHQPEPPYRALLCAIEANDEKAIERECPHVASGNMKDYLELMSLLKDNPIFERIAVVCLPNDFSVEPNRDTIADGVVDRIIDIFTKRSANPELLEYYAEPNSDKTLQVAVAQPTSEMLQNLIFFKADVCGRNLLHRATARCSQFLIDAKVDVNERDSTGEFDTLMHNMRGSTPLHINSDLNTVAVLLANKADVNAENEQGQLPLSFAQSQAHVELLLKYGASLNHASRLVRGGSPLHTAANPVVVASLLMARANIEARHNGLTPLNRAYFQRYGAEAKIPELLNRGADPFQETPELTHWGWYSGHLFNHIDDEFKDVWRKYVRETTTAFLLGTFHARIGQDSSLRRAFASHQPLAEIKILRLIFHMVFHTDNPHYRALK